MRLCKQGKKSSIALYKIFLKNNSTSEEKCWVFSLLVETDFLDTRSYFLPANQIVRLTALNQLTNGKRLSVHY